MAHALSFQGWSVWLRSQSVDVRDGWEQHNERVKGSLIRTASNSWDRIWHAKSPSGMCDNGGACVFLWGACVFQTTEYRYPPSLMERFEAASTPPKLTEALFQCSRIWPTSETHTHTNTCHLYLVADPHTQSQMCARALAGMALRLNTGVFVHSAGPVCMTQRADLISVSQWTLK